MSTNKASVFSVKSSFKRGSSKLGLGDISTAILGVVLLATPALSSNIINAYIQVFYRNIDLLLYTELAQSFWLLNLIPKVVGGVALATVVIKFIRSRYRVDQQKVKLQLGKFLTFTSIICLIFSLFMAVDVPLAEAQTLATTGYILDVPFSSYDWLIGKYGNGNYYAVNGSNWDNMVGGVGSTAWSAYTGNSTALVEQVLAACTSGHILLKDVEFDYGLTIPENVTVTERNNGLDRTFINSANSQGSPITVSVDSVDSSYYLAQDCLGRIINSWTSTSFKAVYDAVSTVLTASQGTILLQSDTTFVSTSTLSAYSNVNVFGNGAVIDIISDATIDGVVFDDVENCVWQDVTINRKGSTVSQTHAVLFSGACTSTTHLFRCNVKSFVEGNHPVGLSVIEISSPQISYCNITGGSGYGGQAVIVGGSATPTISYNNIFGGDDGVNNNNYGINIVETSRPFVIGNIVFGGYGNLSQALRIINSATPTVKNNILYGGDGGTSCYGLYINGAGQIIESIVGNTIFGGDYSRAVQIEGYGTIALADNYLQSGDSAGTTGITITGATANWLYVTLQNNIIFAGDGGALARGLHTDYNASVTLLGNHIYGGNGGTYCSGIFADHTAEIESSGNFIFAGNGGTNGYGVALLADAIGDFHGDTIVSNSYASGFGVYAEGDAQVGLYNCDILSGSLTTCRGIWVQDSVVLTISGGTVKSVGTDVNSQAIYLKNDGKIRISDSTITATSTSAIYLDLAFASTDWVIANCLIETLNPSVTYSIFATNVIADAPVYQCTLIGNLTNITPSNGTATGSNIIK